METTRKREADLTVRQGQGGLREAQRGQPQRRTPPRPRRRRKPPRALRRTGWPATHRPGNIFAGVVHPTLPYGIKGVIWYQGESNAGRAYEYARTVSLHDSSSGAASGARATFSFYWVQLADFMAEKPLPGDSDWAELREAQTRTLRLPNTGQAVIIDIGEGRDIHPRNKYDVASRLVRWALVKDYGRPLPYRSPEYQSVSFQGNKATVTLDCFGSSLRAFDVTEARGFAVCGADKVWHWATGKVVAEQSRSRVRRWPRDRGALRVGDNPVAAPVAVRPHYAWADNPVCNLFSVSPTAAARDAVPTPMARHGVEGPGARIPGVQLVHRTLPGAAATRHDRGRTGAVV
jgi:sialate O-acetylesterase